MSLNSGWETVGGAGKPIKKVGSSKQVAKLEAEAKKKFAEKPLRLEEVRKLIKFLDICGFSLVRASFERALQGSELFRLTSCKAQ